MKVSVIIPTKNRTEPLKECLNSILIQTILPYEIIIVDSSDQEDIREIIKKFKKLNITYIHTKKAGSAYQRNLGAEKSKGDIVLFVDDDTVWDKNYLKEILFIFQKYPKKNMGAVMGKPLLIYDKSIIRMVYKKILQFISAIFLLPWEGDGKFQYSGLPKTVSNKTQKITPCEFIYGFGVAFRKEVFKQFLWDDTFSGYTWEEDDDLAYRVSRKYQNYFTPFAKILHKTLHSKSAGTKKRNGYLSEKKKIECHQYFFKKNMPQDLRHKIAFWRSIIGITLVDSVNSIRAKDYIGIKGLFAGLKNILNKDFEITKNDY